MPSPLKIPLTQEQELLLEPLFDRCKQENDAGSPGMLVAQPVRDSNGECYMRVGFLPHEKAKLLTWQAYGLNA